MHVAITFLNLYNFIIFREVSALKASIEDLNREIQEKDKIIGQLNTGN